MAGPKRFDGKVFLVTGASSGIGEVIAKQLAADGAHVVLAARRTDKLKEVKATIEAGGGSASIECLDVLKYEAVESIVNSIVSKHGKLDGAFNNAGGPAGGGTIVDRSVSDFKQVFELNFFGTYHCMKAELQVMTKQGHGSIVNNISFYASQVTPGHSNYCAAKRGLLALQEVAALEAAPSGVRVNSVSPGFTRPSEALDAFLDQNPAAVAVMTPPLVPDGGGLYHATDVYHSVAFLLDAVTSGAMTGADLQVAGGHNIPTVTLG